MFLATSPPFFLGWVLILGGTAEQACFLRYVCESHSKHSPLESVLKSVICYKKEVSLSRNDAKKQLNEPVSQRNVLLNAALHKQSGGRNS